MKLYASEIRSDDDVKFERIGRRSWMSVLELTAERWGIYLSYQDYWRYEKAEDPEAWHRLYGSWHASIRLAVWDFGYEHFYYDGDHHSVSFGPCHFSWFGWPYRGPGD
jgi:hypothetical protein